MKRIKTGLICMFLLFVCCFIPGERAEAATTAKKLFTFKISDGSVTQSVPIYEYKEDDGDVYVAAKKTQQTLQMTATAKTAKFTITGKTSYFKKNYKSILYIKKVTLTTSKGLNLKVKTKTGELRAFKLGLLRPGITALKVDSTTFTPGSSKLKVQLNMKSATALKAYYKIKDKSGKVVYQKTLGTRKSTNYTTYWSGKPSKGNKAGLSTAGYVPAGTYKLTGYVEYKVGSKTRYISKTVTIKVKKSATSGSTGTNTSTDTSAFKAKNWNWQVILSGDDTLDYMVEKICQEILNNDMTEIQRARAIYTWCDKNLYHIYTNINVNTSLSKVNALAASSEVAAYAAQVDTQLNTGKATVDSSDGYFATKSTQKIKLNWLKAGLTQYQGNCLVMASINQTLLRHAGIDAYIVENTGSAGHHFWNVVKIGGKYYYTDVDRTVYDRALSDSDYTYFLRGTNAFYKEKLYSTVAVNKKTKAGAYRYRIANSVSAGDCPNRY